MTSAGRNLMIFAALLSIGIFTTSRTVQSAPFAQEDQEWDGGYGSVPAELCPPGKRPDPDDPKNRPVFGPLRDVMATGGVSLVGQQALYVNDQGEVFRIQVYGKLADAVTTYTDSVRVCLDVVFASPPQSDSSQVATTPEPTDEEDGTTGPTDADLTIVIEPFGSFGASIAPPSALDDVRAKIAEVNAAYPDLEELLAQLIEMSAVGVPMESVKDYVERLDNRYLFDATIDPGIDYGVAHYYDGLNANSAGFTLYASGKVRGRISAPGFTPRYRTVPLDGVSPRGTGINPGTPTDFYMCVKGRQDESIYTLTYRKGYEDGWSSYAETPWEGTGCS